MITQRDQKPFSDFAVAGQATLVGATLIILLFFAWTY